MITRFRLVTATSLAILMVEPVATAAPTGGPIIDDPGTGRAYQMFTYAAGDDKRWDLARTLAENQSFEGRPGHLATITSAVENAFIVTHFAANLGERWIGGFQLPCESPETDFDCGWEWVNGEGPFAYTNWTVGEGEPNNLGGDENHAGIFHGGDTTWNDEGNLNNVTGFLVEFRGVEVAQNCLEEDDGDSEENGGCNPSGAMLVQLPDDSDLEADDTLSQFLLEPDLDKTLALKQALSCTGQYAFPDPRVGPDGRVVGKLRKLDVFRELGGGPPGALILDELTYGSPCFAVIDGGANFELVNVFPDDKGGVATMTQFPDDVPGIGTVFQCYHPGDNPDLQLGTQFTYQTSVRGDMVENLAAPMTKHCNSPSRGATFKFSFYVLNTHEDCGLNYGGRLGPLKVQLCFKLRALEKHFWLEQSLRNARPTVASSTYNQMTRTLNRAQLFLIAGAYTRAIAELLDFQGQVEAATWATSLANHPGNLIMRTENLLFRAEQLQQAQDNL